MIPIARDTEFILFHAQLESEVFDEIAPEITSLLQTTSEMFAHMADLFTQSKHLKA